MSDCPAMSSCIDQFSVSYSGSRRWYLVTASQPSHCLWPITHIYPQHLQSLDYRGWRVHPCLFFLVTIYTPVIHKSVPHGKLGELPQWDMLPHETCFIRRSSSSPCSEPCFPRTLFPMCRCGQKCSAQPKGFTQRTQRESWV